MTSIRSLSAVVALLSCAAFVHGQSEVTTQQQNVKTVNPTFTTIDVPGNYGVTAVQGINTAGEMVGVYAQTNQSTSNVHSFLLVNGTFTYFDYPGAFGTFAGGINDSGTIVGYAEFSGGLTAQGFLYDGATFSHFRDGNRQTTYAMALNDGGDVVGGAGTPGGTHGFEMRNLKFKDIYPSGEWVYVYATGINNQGEVVGWTALPDVGFAFKSGRYQSIMFPGADDTEAHGLNDGGMIVGWYAMGSSDLAFAWRAGTYISFGYPGAVGTYAYGVNASGQIVGSYTFDYNIFHGFVTSPITPVDFR